MHTMTNYNSTNSSKRANGMIKSLSGPNEWVSFPKSKQMILNKQFTDPLMNVKTVQFSVQGILE